MKQPVVLCDWLFSVTNVSKVHLCLRKGYELHSFLWLNNISLYGHPTLCLSIDLFRVGLLHLSATVNNACKHLFESLLSSPVGILINQLIAVSISWLLMIINYYLKWMLPRTLVYRFSLHFIIFHFILFYLGVKLLDHMGTLCLKMWGPSRESAKAAVPSYIPKGSSNFSTSSSTSLRL